MKPLQFKDYLLIIISALMLSFVSINRANGQISDFTTDKPFFEQTLGIITRTVTDTTCVAEFDYFLGDNELLVFGLRTINMGQHDAGIVDAIDTTGLYWDACHYHYHLEDWNTVTLLDGNYNTVKAGGKVGWNLRDGGNVIKYIKSSTQGAAFAQWAGQYGTIDYSMENNLPNDNFNGDTHMGISAGYYDTYLQSTWGNSINITGVANGIYRISCVGNFSRYFNQGLNVFPDSFQTVVTISGSYPNRTITLGGSFCTQNYPPLSPPEVYVDSASKMVWYDCTGMCTEPNIQVWLVHKKTGQPDEYRDAGVIILTGNCYGFHTNALSHSDLQQAAKRNLNNLYIGNGWEYGGGEWFYQYQAGATQSNLISYPDAPRGRNR